MLKQKQAKSEATSAVMLGEFKICSRETSGNNGSLTFDASHNSHIFIVLIRIVSIGHESDRLTRLSVTLLIEMNHSMSLRNTL